MTYFDSSHHDLPPEREADVSPQEADALDARLNEIAQRQGRATAWFSLRGPKRRSRIRETANVPDFAQAFHQRVERMEAADAGSAGLDPTLWEHIMASTTASAGVTTARPATSTSSPHNRARSASRPAVARSFWTGFANATLAVVLLLAAFGVWRVYDRGQGEPPPTETHSLAFQPETSATPETVTVPDEDIPTPANGCDFTRDLPIYQQVNDAPVDATVLLVKTSGDLVLDCPGEAQQVLATGVGQTWPVGWPGIVAVFPTDPIKLAPFDEMSRPETQTYVDVFSGRQVTVGARQNEMLSSSTYSREPSPWLVAPTNGNLPQWTITDLRTMESRDVASMTDAPLTLPPGANVLTSAANDGTLALAYMSMMTISADAEVYAPLGVLIVDDSLAQTHWIPLPDDLDAVEKMMISPTGDYLALVNGDGDPLAQEPFTYVVVRTDTGEEIGRSDEISVMEPSLLWTQDGTQLVYIDDTGVSSLHTADGQIGRLLEHSDDLRELRPTYDPNTVLVTRSQAEEIATETPDLVRPQIYSVNVQTGEVVTIDGVDMSHNLSPWEQDTRFLVMADTYVMDAEPHTYRVVDAVTGEELGLLEDVQFADWPPGMTGFGRHSVASTNDGLTEVLAFGTQHLYLLQQGDDGPEIVQLPTLWSDLNMTLTIFLAPDGTWLSAGQENNEARTRYLLDLTDPNAEWVSLDDNVVGSGMRHTFFLPGTGD